MAAVKVEGAVTQCGKVGKGRCSRECVGNLPVALAMGHFIAAEIFGAMTGEVGADVFDRRVLGR